MRRRAVMVVALATLAACARWQPPPPPAGVSTVALAPVANLTGGEIVVSGEWLLDRLLGVSRTTLSDVLARAARDTLAGRGFAVRSASGAPRVTAADAARTAAADGVREPTLWIAVRRWEVDVPRLQYVSAAVDAALVDPGSGRIMWEAHRPLGPIPTGGAPTPGAASADAARALVRQLLDGWRPAE